MIEKNAFKEWLDATEYLLSLKKEAGVKDFLGNNKGTILGTGLGIVGGGALGYADPNHYYTPDERKTNAIAGAITGGMFGSLIGGAKDSLNKFQKYRTFGGDGPMPPAPKNDFMDRIKQLDIDPNQVPSPSKPRKKEATLEYINNTVSGKANSVREYFKHAYLQNALKHLKDGAQLAGYGALAGGGLGLIRATGNENPVNMFGQPETFGQKITRYGRSALDNAATGAAVGGGLKLLSLGGKLREGLTQPAVQQVKVGFNLGGVKNFLQRAGNKVIDIAKQNPNAITTIGGSAAGAGIGALSATPENRLAGAVMGGVGGGALGAAATYGRKALPLKALPTQQNKSISAVSSISDVQMPTVAPTTHIPSSPTPIKMPPPEILNDPRMGAIPTQHSFTTAITESPQTLARKSTDAAMAEYDRLQHTIRRPTAKLAFLNAIKPLASKALSNPIGRNAVAGAAVGGISSGDLKGAAIGAGIAGGGTAALPLLKGMGNKIPSLNNKIQKTLPMQSSVKPTTTQPYQVSPGVHLM